LTLDSDVISSFLSMPDVLTALM